VALHVMLALFSVGCIVGFVLLARHDERENRKWEESTMRIVDITGRGSECTGFITSPAYCWKPVITAEYIPVESQDAYDACVVETKNSTCWSEWAYAGQEVCECRYPQLDCVTRCTHIPIGSVREGWYKSVTDEVRVREDPRVMDIGTMLGFLSIPIVLLDCISWYILEIMGIMEDRSPSEEEEEDAPSSSEVDLTTVEAGNDCAHLSPNIPVNTDPSCAKCELSTSRRNGNSCQDACQDALESASHSSSEHHESASQFPSVVII
jgi:hypothetical protein